MRGASLVGRVVATVLLLELLCALAYTGTALWHERKVRLRAFDVVLEGRSDSLLGAVQDAEDPADNVAIDPRELNLPREDVYAVYNQGGRLLGSSPAAAAGLIQRAGDGLRYGRVGTHRYRVLEREGMRIIDRSETEGAGLRRPVTIVYAVPTHQLWHQIFEAVSFNLLVTAVLVCVTTALLIVSLRRLLRPLQELATVASGVSASSLSFTAPATALATQELRPLANALSAAMVRLKQAFEMEQRLVGDAAHELKTAVAVVRSSVQVLSLRPRSGEEYKAGLERILLDNERVEDLVARMLTTVRMEQAAGVRPDAVDVSESVAGALSRLRSFGEARGVRLNAAVSSGVFARISAEEVQTLVSNLVVNAVQHSPEGASVAVVLTGRRGTEEAAMLEVRDEGTGIAEASLPYVFDRFYREDRSRSRETGGAGLGLAICKGIVESAGGRMELESVQGQGTTVRAFFSLL